jgi:hypothetical protein
VIEVIDDAIFQMLEIVVIDLWCQAGWYDGMSVYFSGQDSKKKEV